MDQDKTDPAQRPQTLLEAAKGALSVLQCIGFSWAGDLASSLDAAIAREEANPSPWRGETALVADLHNRAQQAEASAAWHRSESERLSAELAKAREWPAESLDRYLTKTLRELCAPSEMTTIDAAKAMRQRAEKAEAELAKAIQARQLDRAVDVLTRIEPRDPTTGFTFATYRRLLEALGGKS